MSDDEVKVRVTGESSSAASAMKSAAAAVKDGVGQMKDSLSSISEHFSKFQGVLIAVGAVLAGGKLFKEAINETREFTKESIMLGRTLGMTATEASAYAIALDDVGSNSDELANAGRGLTRQLKTNETGLNSMGLVTRDSNGHLRQMSDILTDAIGVVNSYKEGTDRNLAAQTAFGRGVTANSMLFRLNSAAIEEAKKKQEELGLVVGAESVRDYEQYRVAMNDVHDVMKAFAKAIGDAVMPVLTQLGEWFASIGPFAVQILKTAIADLVTVFWVLYFVVQSVWEIIKAMVISVAGPIAALGSAINKALHGNFVGAKQDLAEIGPTLREVWVDAGEGMVTAFKKARDRVKDLFSDPTAIKSAEAEGKDFKAAPKKTGSDDRFREWSVALEKIKDAEGEFRQHDIAADIDYWSQKLALVTGNTAKDKALREKLEHEILSLKRAAAAEQKQLDEEAVNQRKSIALQELEDKKETLRAQREFGRITEQQELAALRDLEAQKYAIEKAALDERLKLVEADKLARAKVMNEIELLQRQHASDLKKMDDDAAIARKKQVEDMLTPVSQAVQKSVTGMIQGTLTLQKAVGNMARSILAEFLSMSVKRLISWVAGEVAMTQATVVGATVRKTVTQDAHKQGLAASAAAAFKEIATSAYVTMANVYRSVSAIPYIGWILAPIAAAVAGAAVIGFGSSIPSARGGYDIPAGVNPLTQLHEKEMVLPQSIAESFRNAAAGGGGGGSFTLRTQRATSTHDLVKRTELARLMKTLNQRFAF